MSGKMLVGAISALVLSSCATTYSVTPVDTGAAMVTYGDGTSTTDLELANGAVQVTPLGVATNGRLTFAVAGYNKLAVPSDFGPEHFAASADGAGLKLYGYDQLEREARHAAGWAAFAVAPGRCGGRLRRQRPRRTRPRTPRWIRPTAPTR